MPEPRIEKAVENHEEPPFESPGKPPPEVGDLAVE
jgi:hypothetical protein